MAGTTGSAGDNFGEDKPGTSIKEPRIEQVEPKVGVGPGPMTDVTEGGGEVSRMPPSYPTSRPMRPQTIDKLNEFLRGELSAVETYELAIVRARDPELVSALKKIRDSHDLRVTTLRDLIRGYHGEPSHTSGVWGAFTRLVQRGADLFGDRAALSVLEEGEDHGLKNYMENVDVLDFESRAIVENELLPDQRKTHDLCRSLEHFVKAA